MRRLKLCLGVWMIAMTLLGCTSIEKEAKSVEVSFEVIDEDDIPMEMLNTIHEQKESGFRIAYEDENGIYVGVGYGMQEQEGYQIEVDKCSISEHFVYVHTNLIGPEKEEKKKVPSFPYIVFRVNETGKQVIF